MAGPRELLFEPFDPKKHKPIKNGRGEEMTELEITVQDDKGRWMNVPSIWFMGDGRPTIMNGDDATAVALEYEQQTGKRFPRFADVGMAEERAMHRSARGGAKKRPLAEYYWERGSQSMMSKMVK